MSQTWEIEGFLEVKDNRLCIDGVPAAKLAAEHGTPLFIFSENRIRRNIERLRRAEKLIGRPLKICYAAKAMSTLAILAAVREAGGDIEVNSGGELWKALKVGFRGDQIIFNGTSKEIWEIERAVGAEIYAIQVDSPLELELIEQTAKRLKKTANVSLRLVPEIESNTHFGLRTALLTSKFGMMPNEALAAFREYKNSPHLNLAGIHLHIGSQNPDAAGYAAALQVLFHNLFRIYNETDTRLSHINLGGGFPVNYLRAAPSDAGFAPHQRDMLAADFDPAEAVEKAWHAITDSAKSAGALDLLDKLTLLLEPGRSIVADAGILLTSVRNIKNRPLTATSSISSREIKKPSAADDARLVSTDCKQQQESAETWLLTDAGFNLLLSMATYSWYYQIISAERSGEAHDFPYKVAGPLCDGGDVYFDIEGRGRLPDHRLLPGGVRLGELLAILNCGAYALSQASQYNARFLPAVILIRDGKPELARRRDTFDDLASNDIFG